MGSRAAAERQRLDGHRRHAGFDHLEGEIVLVARLVRALPALIVDADDVVNAAAVTGHADHRRVWSAANSPAAARYATTLITIKAAVAVSL